jgi:hypothetical protein
MKNTVRFILIAVAGAIGTWLIGWFAVPVVAFIAGLARSKPPMVAAACAASWLLLLGIDAATGNLGAVGSVLAKVIGLPGPALFAVTLALPALLGWSAASLGTRNAEGR